MVGLKDFDDFVGVYDLIEKHEDRIRKAYEETGRILESFEERKAEKKKRINLQ